MQSSLSRFPFERDEYIRLLLKSLSDMGFKNTELALEAESGICLNEPYLPVIRGAVLQGDWKRAIKLLDRAKFQNRISQLRASFEIMRHSYIELLLLDQTEASLSVLRNEILGYHKAMQELVVPENTTCHTVDKDVENLAALLMCPDALSVRSAVSWGLNTTLETEREKLFHSIVGLMAPEVRIPEYRLEKLVCQALQLQSELCEYHNTNKTKFPLSEDHACSKTQIPGKTKFVLDGHDKKEVWCMAFSNNGILLASAGLDGNVCIWDVFTGDMIHKLKLDFYDKAEKSSALTLRWSPGDKCLLAGGQDGVIRSWSKFPKESMTLFEYHKEAVTGLAWLPNGEKFVSGSLDKSIVLWGSIGLVLAQWSKEHVSDVTVNRDGSIVYAVFGDSIIRSFRIVDGPKPYFQLLSSINGISTVGPILPPDQIITSISLSNDDNYMLIQTAGDKDNLCSWDMKRSIMTRYSGMKQGRYILRGCFGGRDQRFIACGGFDGSIKIWSSSDQKCITTLQGHACTVNSVLWNHSNVFVVASCSDDGTVRIWVADDFDP